MARAKTKVVDNLIQEVIDNFGDNFVMKKEAKTINSISTGSISLDASIGVGGVPRGKISVIYGAEGSGKTTIALNLCKNALDLDLRVLYVEVENMLDWDRILQIVGEKAESDYFEIIQPKTAEDALKIIGYACESGKYGLVILDSIGGLAPVKAMEEDVDKRNVGLVSGLLTNFFKKNSFHVRVNDVALVMINQVRDKIGAFVPTYELPGGHALKHYAGIIILLSKFSTITIGEEDVGIMVKFVLKKNKVGPPFRTYNFPLMFKEGISELMDLINFAVTIGVIKKTGAHYKHEDIYLGKGLNKVVEYFKESEDTKNLIKQKVFDVLSEDSKALVDEELELGEDA